MIFSIQIIPYLIALLVMVGVAISALRFYKYSYTSYAIPALILSQIIWTLSYIFELSSSTLEAKLLWNNIQFICMLLGGWTLLAFALIYNSLFPAGRYRPWIPVILLHLPLEVALFVQPEWFRASLRLLEDTPTAALHYTIAPGLAIFHILIWLTNLASVFLIMQSVLRAHRFYHAQSAILLVAILIPMASSLAYHFLLQPNPNQNFIPLFLMVSDLIILYGLRRYHLLRYLPVAREILFERMNDPVLVLSPDDRVIDINKTALKLFDAVEKDVIGKPIQQLLPAFPDSSDPRRQDGAANFDVFITSRIKNENPNPELELSIAERIKVFTYNLSLSPLTDWLGSQSGCLLIMRDSSEQRRAQDALREAHDNLELHVRERTRQLDQTVTTLSREIDERIRVEQAKERYVSRMVILHGIDRAILQAQTLAETAAAALNAMRPLVPYDRACVMVNNPDGPGLRILASTADGESNYLKDGAFKTPDGAIRLSNAHPYCEACQSQDENNHFSVPLTNQDRTIGMIHFCSARPFKPTQEQAEISQEIADQLAIAIRQASLLERTRRQVSELAALNQMARSIASNFELDQAVQSLLHQSSDLVGADVAFLATIDQETNELIIKPGFIYSPEGALPPLNAGEGVTWQTYQSQQAILVEDYPEYPHALPAWVDAGLMAVISVPVTTGEHRVGVLNLCSFHPEKRFDQHKLELARMVASQTGLAVRNVQLYDSAQAAAREISSAYDATIQGWALALELREKETAGHSHRVVSLTLAFASAMRFTPEELVHVHRGALLHDIGKMGIPDSILLKPGPLTDEEWVIMRQHPVYAYRLLADIPYLRPALDIPYCHHEHWDGSGYPRGLKGEEIPLAARIFTIIDIWDALRSDRPYRPAWSPERVQAYLLEKAGSLLDPALVRIFLELLDESREMD